MTCYLVHAAGEPVALVASIDLARELVSSQPRGYYIVDEIQAEPLDSGPGARAERRSPRDPDRRHGDRPRVTLGRMVPSRHRGARQTDQRRR
jgi:hypothetical protein